MINFTKIRMLIAPLKRLTLHQKAMNFLLNNKFIQKNVEKCQIILEVLLS